MSAATRIGSGTKIDNQVHIGHDTVIGRNVLLAAQVGIAGCAVLEDEVTLWGQVGVNSSVRIGEKAVVLGQAGVTKSLEGNKTYFGTLRRRPAKIPELAALRTALPWSRSEIVLRHEFPKRESTSTTSALTSLAQVIRANGLI